MNRAFWISGLVVGAHVGLVVASIATFLDWRTNPGGIFHGVDGTNWAVVMETAITWLAPVAVLAGVITWLTLLVWSRSR